MRQRNVEHSPLLSVPKARRVFKNTPEIGADALANSFAALAKIVYWGSLALLVLFLLVWLALVIAGIADVVATFSQAYYCPPSDPGCYGECDPTDPTECLFPFPSSHFMVADKNAPTGFRVNFPDRSLPKPRSGKPYEARFLNELDGFSPVGPLLFYLADVSSVGMTPTNNIGASVLTNTTVVLLNTKTNTTHPHWVEFDFVDPKSPSVIIQPATPMEFGTRYVVGIRRLISNTTGQVIAPSQAMQTMLASEFSVRQSSVTKERWEYYQLKIFPVLESQASFNRSEIQLAWDFVTVSRETLLGRAEAMRDDALRRQANASLPYGIDAVVEDDCSKNPNNTMGRTIYGHITTPLYLTSSQRLAKLPRTAKGVRVDTPEPLGTHDSNFIIRIPCSILTANGTKRAKTLIQYGHGLFGSRAEVGAGWISPFANANDYVLVASDWFGMAKYVILLVSFLWDSLTRSVVRFDTIHMMRVLLGDPTDFVGLPESSLQGFVDLALTLRAVSNNLAVSEPSLKVNGVPILDNPLGNGSTSIGYYGISQGGILGGAYVAFSTDHHRGVLGVPGSPYALLLGRSVDFDLYKSIMQLNMYTWRQMRLAITLMGMLWDQSEAAGWLTLMRPQNKQILMQAALYDAQVTTLGAEIMARAYGAYTVANQTQPVWGVPEQAAPLPPLSSALVEWKYDFAPNEPVENIPPLKQFDTHGCVRKEIRGQLQIRDFLATGAINQYCAPICSSLKCPS